MRPAIRAKAARRRWPTRLARLPLVGDIGIYFKPERLVRRSLAEVYADPAMVTPERVRRFSRAAALSRQPRGHPAARARRRSRSIRRRSSGCDVPTLILWGAQDRWVPVADAFRFQSDIKGAKLEIFEKLGHDPMEEDPRATAAAVAAFLAPIPARPIPPPPPPDPAPGEVQPSVVPEKDSGLQQRHHLGEGGVGDGFDLGLGAVLDGMGDVDDGGLEAQRIALRGDAVDEARW